LAAFTPLAARAALEAFIPFAALAFAALTTEPTVAVPMLATAMTAADTIAAMVRLLRQVE
jgi:hypothetical protein